MASASCGGRPAGSCRPSAAAMLLGTCAPSVIGASSTHQRPSGNSNLAAVAAASARRVLPMPPAPTIDHDRVLAQQRVDGVEVLRATEQRRRGRAGCRGSLPTSGAGGMRPPPTHRPPRSRRRPAARSDSHDPEWWRSPAARAACAAPPCAPAGCSPRPRASATRGPSARAWAPPARAARRSASSTSKARAPSLAGAPSISTCRCEASISIAPQR